jgi:hypothetical protein
MAIGSLGNPPFYWNHFEGLVSEDCLQLFKIRRVRGPVHAIPLKSSIRPRDRYQGEERFFAE